MSAESEKPQDVLSIADLTDVSSTAAKVPWKSLFVFTKLSHTAIAITGCLASISSGAAIPAFSYFLGRIFDRYARFASQEISGAEFRQQTSSDCILVIVLGSAKWVVNTSLFASWIYFGELQAKNARDQLYKAMLEKEMEWYDTRSTGVHTMIPRSQAQIRDLQLATSQPLGYLLEHITTFLGGIGLSLYVAWDVALVTIASVPIAALVLSLISNRMQRPIKNQAEAMDKASKIFNNAISNMDMVKCYNGQGLELQRYLEAIRTGARYYLKVAQGNAAQIGFVRMLLLSVFVQGFWYGNHVVDLGHKSAGQILTAFWSAMMALSAIEEILPQAIVLEKGRTAGFELRALLSKIEKGKQISQVIGGMRPNFCEGDITMKNLKFSYPSRPGRRALDGASFFFPAGETTYILGKSGSGKSTLSNLLLRFYRPESGTITIDENDLYDLDINWLRNNITLVQQDTFLFNESLARNIAFGGGDHECLSKYDIQEALSMANLNDTIAEMSDGLETMIGNGGKSLSGGQRQRVALARARLRDTSILILDEATSALDHTSKHRVMEAVKEWRRGKTTIIITHDISHIGNDDFVYVLQSGAVVEEGYKRSLETADEGHLASFHSLQTSPMSAGFDDSLRSTEMSPVLKETFQPPTPGTAAENPRMYSEQPRFDGTGWTVNGATMKPETSSLDRPALMKHNRRRSQVMSAMSAMSTTGFTNVNNQGSSETMPPYWQSTDLAGQRLGDTLTVNTSGDKVMSPTEYFPPVLTSPLKHISMGRRPSTPVPTPDNYELVDVENLTVEVKPEGEPPAVDSSRAHLSLGQIFKTVWPVLKKKDRISLGIGLACACAHGGAVPIFSWVFSQLLGVLLSKGPDRSAGALKWSLCVLGSAVGDGAASYGMHYFLERAGQAWVDGIRTEATMRVLNQPREWFDERSDTLQEIVSCLDRCAEEMRNLVGRFAGFLLVVVVILVTMFVWCMIISWKMTLVALSIAPLIYAITRGFEVLSGKYEGKSNVASEAAANVFTETIGNIRTIRALTLEAYFHRKYSLATVAAAKIGVRRAVISGIFYGLGQASATLVTALVFWYGAQLASSEQAGVIQVVEVITMFIFSLTNITNAMSMIPQISQSRDTAAQLLQLAELPLNRSHEHQGQLPIHNIEGDIVYNNVSFHYPTRPNQTALSSVNLTIPLQTSTALVGASGSGKSTIFSLLLGLYPLETFNPVTPTTPRSKDSSLNGAIVVNNQPLTSLDLTSFRSLVGYVPQNSTLFPLSISENITYGLPTSSPYRNDPASIVRAARLAGLHDFIISLPQSYNTLVGEGGTTLSGGQLQRLALARAFVRRPRLLVLDEPTSSLDPEGAALVRASLATLVHEGATVVVVTHDEEMMRALDRVVVLAGGSVAEEGTWTELMVRQSGVLRRLLLLGDLVDDGRNTMGLPVRGISVLAKV